MTPWFGLVFATLTLGEALPPPGAFSSAGVLAPEGSVVRSVHRRSVQDQKVHNLRIGEHPTYSVEGVSVLVHNVGRSDMGSCFELLKLLQRAMRAHMTDPVGQAMRGMWNLAEELGLRSGGRLATRFAQVMKSKGVVVQGETKATFRVYVRVGDVVETSVRPNDTLYAELFYPGTGKLRILTFKRSRVPLE